MNTENSNSFLRGFYDKIDALIENEKNSSIRSLVSAYHTSLTDIAEGILKLTPLDTPYKATKFGIQFAKKCYNMLISKGEISEKDIEQLHKATSSSKSHTKKRRKNAHKKSSQGGRVQPTQTTVSAVATRVVTVGCNYLLSKLSSVLSMAKKTWCGVQQIKKGIDNAFDVHEIRQIEKTDQIAIQLIKQEGRKRLQRVAGKKQKKMVKKMHAAAINTISAHTKEKTENIRKKIRKPNM